MVYCPISNYQKNWRIYCIPEWVIFHDVRKILSGFKRQLLRKPVQTVHFALSYDGTYYQLLIRPLSSLIKPLPKSIPFLFSADGTSWQQTRVDCGVNVMADGWCTSNNIDDLVPVNNRWNSLINKGNENAMPNWPGWAERTWTSVRSVWAAELSCGRDGVRRFYRFDQNQMRPAVGRKGILCLGLLKIKRCSLLGVLR